MAEKRLPSYLRTFRKRSGLTQKELAFLVGVKSEAQISRIERLKRVPSAETLLAIMIIFQESPEEIFPHQYNWLMRDIRERATILHEEVQGRSGRQAKIKLDALEKVLRSEPDKPINYDHKTTV